MKTENRTRTPKLPVVIFCTLLLPVFALLAYLQLKKQTTPEPSVPKLVQGIDAIRQSGELVILTVKSPTTYKKQGERVTGYEADLTRAFAKYLGVKPRYRVFDNISDLMAALENGEGHIAAPGLSQREMRLEDDGAEPLIFGPAYKNVRPVLTCRRGEDAPKDISQISDFEVGVIAVSGIEETLEKLKVDAPDLKWQTFNINSGYGLAEKVDEGELDCAFMDSNTLAIARRKFPELQTAFYLGNEDRQLAWRISPASADLLPELKAWFQTMHQDGFLIDLDETYYGHLDEFDYVDIATFRRRIDTRLPSYEEEFREAAGEYDLDWTMLASQGYQESHWNPKAKSPTGVRGLMMLTLPTAKEVGVTNRLDPEESIEGGALYLKRIYRRLPDSITGYDRLWMAMAAYNVGYGHLQDARRLAARLGMDENKWRNIDDVLPLLTQKKYYSTLRHGYARGYEPVRYVRRIREYDEVLSRNVEAPETPPFYPERTSNAD